MDSPGIKAFIKSFPDTEEQHAITEHPANCPNQESCHGCYITRSRCDCNKPGHCPADKSQRARFSMYPADQQPGHCTRCSRCVGRYERTGCKTIGTDCTPRIETEPAKPEEC